MKLFAVFSFATVLLLTAMFSFLASSAPSLVVSADNTGPVNIRSSPSVSGDVVGQIAPGADATVVQSGVSGPDGDAPWIQVSYNAQMGYVRSDVVSAPHPAGAVTATSAPEGTTAGVFPIGIYADYPLIDTADFTKRPDAYKGQKFSVLGKAFNVREKNGLTTFQMWTEPYDYSYPVVVGFSGSSTSLQDGTRLRVYGVGIGSVSGSNSFGASLTQPSMSADYVGPPTDAKNEATADAYDRSHSATLTSFPVYFTQSAGTLSALGASSTALALKYDPTLTAIAKTVQPVKP